MLGKAAPFPLPSFTWGLAEQEAFLCLGRKWWRPHGRSWACGLVGRNSQEPGSVALSHGQSMLGVPHSQVRVAQGQHGEP